MRSVILNGAMNAGPELPTVPDVPVVTGRNVPSQGFNLEAAMNWWETGTALQQAGQPTGMDLDPAQVLAAAGSGAAAGAAAGGIGAGLGAVLGAVSYVAQWFIGNRPARGWENAGPGVHAWFTYFGPQEYLDWVRANNPGALTSVQTAIEGVFAWALDAYDYVFVPGFAWYSGIPDGAYISGLVGWMDGFESSGNDATVSSQEWINELKFQFPATSVERGVERLSGFYANLGIDYAATMVHRNNGGSGFMMFNRHFEGQPNPEQSTTASSVKEGLSTLGWSVGASLLIDQLR